jgi:AraC-like DNA-binding protein
MICLESIDTIISWSTTVKTTYLADSRHIFFVFKISFFLQGPLLYWYTRSLIYSDFKFNKLSWLHLIPAALFPFYVALIYADLAGSEEKINVSDYNVLFENILFRSMVFAHQISVVAYAILSILLLADYRKRLKAKFSNIEKIDLNWLTLLVGGFLAIWLWVFISPIAHQFGLPKAAHYIGLLGNYMKFIIVNALVVYSLIYSDVVHGIKTQIANLKGDGQDDFQQDQIDKIVSSMEVEQLYLEPELTLEQLSEALEMSSRIVSSIINRKFDQNFFEFVNSYRVEEAKKLLHSSDRKLSMLDIMAEAGFNSKSAFNRFFKKYADMTPTQYKRSKSE